MSETSETILGDEPDHDQQLEAVIADYIRASEVGVPPDRRQLLEAHPQLADDLRQFFGQRDRMNQWAEPIRGFGDAVTQTVGPGQQLSYVGNYELLGEVARGGMGVVYSHFARHAKSTNSDILSSCWRLGCVPHLDLVSGS